MLRLFRMEAEIIFKTMPIGTLSPGRAFGAAQMMNIHSRYHATLKTKSTCHILLIYWHMVSGLIISAVDLAWVESMKQRAKKIYEAWLIKLGGQCCSFGRIGILQVSKFPHFARTQVVHVWVESEIHSIGKIRAPNSLRKNPHSHRQTCSVMFCGMFSNICLHRTNM